MYNWFGWSCHKNRFHDGSWDSTCYFQKDPHEFIEVYEGDKPSVSFSAPYNIAFPLGPFYKADYEAVIRWAVRAQLNKIGAENAH